jgi:3-hydroxyisobutyrate dehydrogenase-like beta-hydroxyacid dehydrogenase
MAGHLLKDGARLIAHTRSPAKQETWLAAHPRAVGASSSAEAAAQADVVITCVGDDADLADVYQGPTGVLSHLRRGALVIDHTTASADIARDLEADAISKQASFVDAPVSGGSAGAENQALSIMVGGSEAAFERASPILEVYGRTISRMGPAGSGQIAKMVNQICIAGVLQGLAEGLGLAVASGLDTTRLLPIMGGGAAGSWQMHNRSSFMLSEDFNAGFTARLMHKDLGLAISASARNQLDSPVVELVRNRYAELINRGLGHEDFSNLFRLVINHF